MGWPDPSKSTRRSQVSLETHWDVVKTLSHFKAMALICWKAKIENLTVCFSPTPHFFLNRVVKHHTIEGMDEFPHCLMQQEAQSNGYKLRALVVVGFFNVVGPTIGQNDAVVSVIVGDLEETKAAAPA